MMEPKRKCPAGQAGHSQAREIGRLDKHSQYIKAPSVQCTSCAHYPGFNRLCPVGGHRVLRGAVQCNEHLPIDTPNDEVMAALLMRVETMAWRSGNVEGAAHVRHALKALGGGEQ